MRVVSLHIYPVKGTRAVDLGHADLGERGFEGDRRWVVVDAAGKFVSQRSHPQLATVAATPTAAGITLSAPGMADLAVERPTGDQRAQIIVWSDTVSAALAGEPAHAWVSRALGGVFRLVFMDGRADRAKIGEWVPRPVPISFADAYPVLVATTGSLTALNAEIVRAGGAAVPMPRFRPNIVIDCDDPWQEDFWQGLRIGAAEIDLVKPSDRCVVTTTDQQTGARMGKEPLASLARLRRSADPRINGVLFAWNAVPRVRGRISVGDTVEVIARRPEGFALRARAGADASAKALIDTLLTSP